MRRGVKPDAKPRFPQYIGNKSAGRTLALSAGYMDTAQIALRIANKRKKIFDTLQLQGSLIRIVDEFFVINEALEVFYCLRIGHKPGGNKTINV